MDRVKDERPVDVPARLALGGADYGLCGALLHVGTPHAGHYEAEVKDLATGAWWTFNDDACGAVDADASRRADGTSAYVLVYLREDVLDELAEDREDAADMGMSAQGVPRALKDEILVENAVLRDAAAAAAASRATLAVDVRLFPGARTWRSAWPRDVSAAEALADARAALLGDLDGDAPEVECRLRAWDPSRACGFGAPLPEGGAAADAGGGDAWVLEVRDVAGCVEIKSSTRLQCARY